MTVDCVVPARNEAGTVGSVVGAALDCAAVREVIVVDDGSTDATGDEALAAGAKLIIRDGSIGSKAHALRAGVDASDADVLLFVDADCIGLRGVHLDAVVAPVLDGRSVLSVGTFDYGRFWNPQVLRWPPISGERCLPRWLFDKVTADHLRGWTIELRIDEIAGAIGVPVSIRTMPGVQHRTKRDKFGARDGARRTLQMYGELVGAVWPLGDIPLRSYPRLLRLLTVEPAVPARP